MMDGKQKVEGPTKKELSYLKKLKAILPKVYKQNYKCAMSELNSIKGVKKKELIKFITSVYDLEEKQVARDMALCSKKLTRKAQSVKIKETRKKRGTRQLRHSTKNKDSYVLSKAKQRALNRVNELCGICGGSKPKCKKKKVDKCKKKKKKKKKEDPCKSKCQKKRRRSSCKKRKPSCNTCDRGPGQEKRIKRDRYSASKEPTKRTSPVHEPSSGGSDTSNSNESDAKQTKNDGEVNGGSNTTENTKPESDRQKQLYIS